MDELRPDQKPKFGTQEIGICEFCTDNPWYCTMDPPGATATCAKFENNFESSEEYCIECGGFAPDHKVACSEPVGNLY